MLGIADDPDERDAAGRDGGVLVAEDESAEVGDLMRDTARAGEEEDMAVGGERMMTAVGTLESGADGDGLAEGEIRGGMCGGEIEEAAGDAGLCVDNEADACVHLFAGA